jgi:hypothetical protein
MLPVVWHPKAQQDLLDIVSFVVILELPNPKLDIPAGVTCEARFPGAGDGKNEWKGQTGVMESLQQIAQTTFAKNRARQPFHDSDEEAPGKKDQQQEEKHAQGPSNGHAQRIGQSRPEKINR